MYNNQNTAEPDFAPYVYNELLYYMRKVDKEFALPYTEFNLNED